MMPQAEVAQGSQMRVPLPGKGGVRQERMIQPHTSEWLCAQVVQLFESWAHHLSPAQFGEFGKPYAEQVLRAVREKHPETPLIYHGNGGDHPLFKLYHTRL